MQQIFYWNVLSDVVRIRLAQQNNEVDKRAYTAQTKCEQPEKPGADLALVEAVNAPAAEEETEDNSHPLVLHSANGNSRGNYRGGNIIVVIIVVYDDRLTGSGSCSSQFLHLTSAVGAENSVLGYYLTAVLAELRRAVYRLLYRLASC